VAKVIDRELTLPARTDSGLRSGHHARIGDQDVDGASRGQEPLRESVHAGQICEVEFVHFDTVDTGQGTAGSLRVAGRDDHPGTGLGQRPGGGQTEARVSAGHDGEDAVQVDSGEGVVGGAVNAETGLDGGFRSCHVQLSDWVP
jgi:hypothetical protein